MIKKIATIFLTMIFIASAMGITINSHFCGSKLNSVGLTKQDCCCKKNSKMAKDCCKDEVQTIKITDNYYSSASADIKKIDIAPFILNAAPSVDPILLSKSTFLSYHSLPPPRGEDRVIVFRSLLI